MMWRRLALCLTILLLLFGCAQTKAPELKTHKEQHFSIGLPEGWTVQDKSESLDQVTFADPKAPETFVVVYTYFVPENARWPKLEMRWQFAGRNPTSIKSPNGLTGIMAEGPRQPDETKQIVAVGYSQPGSWDMIAEGGAPKTEFEAKRALLTAILQSLAPDPIK